MCWWPVRLLNLPPTFPPVIRCLLRWPCRCFCVALNSVPTFTSTICRELPNLNNLKFLQFPTIAFPHVLENLLASLHRFHTLTVVILSVVTIVLCSFLCSIVLEFLTTSLEKDSLPLFILVSKTLSRLWLASYVSSPLLSSLDDSIHCGWKTFLGVPPQINYHPFTGLEIQFQVKCS